MDVSPKEKRFGSCLIALAILIAVTIAAIYMARPYVPGKTKNDLPVLQTAGNPADPSSNDADKSPRRFVEVEVASDGAAVLDADTGEPVFIIDDAQRFIEEAGYAYDEDSFRTSNAKYAGGCISEAVLSHNKEDIAFAVSCLPGDMPEPWIGAYGKDGFRFLYGGGGGGLAWSDDDASISFEAYLGLTGWNFAKIIDVKTGAISSDEDCETYEARKEGSREMCYHEKAKTDRDEVLCGKIGTLELRSDCYVDLAIIKDDYGICMNNKIVAALASDCAEYFGMIRK